MTDQTRESIEAQVTRLELQLRNMTARADMLRKSVLDEREARSRLAAAVLEVAARREDEYSYDQLDRLDQLADEIRRAE